MGSIFVSEDACAPLRRALEKTGHNVFNVLSSDIVPDAISSHPDIYMCRIKNILTIDDMIVTEPDIREMYIRQMQSDNDNFAESPIIPALRADDGRGHIVFEMGHIGYDYPEDAVYNAAATDRFFLHNISCTSPSLLDRARSAGLEIIPVRQGYTKCSCVTVGDRAVITADGGILRTLSAYNEEILKETGRREDTIDVLPVEQGHVKLPGFDYGFLGGASGCVEDVIYFNGDLSLHPDFEKIRIFIEERGYRIRYFPGEELTDIGSVIWLP